MHAQLIKQKELKKYTAYWMPKLFIYQADIPNTSSLWMRLLYQTLKERQKDIMKNCIINQITWFFLLLQDFSLTTQFFLYYLTIK